MSPTESCYLFTMDSRDSLFFNFLSFVKGGCKMRFTIQQDKFIDKLSHLIGIVPVHNPMPILTNILISADKEKGLTLTTTDLEISVTANIDTYVSEDGIIAVPAKSLTEIVRSLPDEEQISINVEEDKCNIECGNSFFTLMCAQAEDFPILPEKTLENPIKISAKLFTKMITRSSFAVSPMDTRPAFTGIFWALKPEEQVMVATDGKKLTKYTTHLKLDVGESGRQLPDEGRKVIIPVKGLNLLSKIISEEHPFIDIRIEENTISFYYNDYKIFSRLIEANYPDYEKVIPYDNPNVLEVEKNKLKTAIHRVSLLSSVDTYKIKLTFQPKVDSSDNENELVISSADQEKGSAREILPVQSEITDFEIGFNYRYLLEIINALDTERIQIKFKEPLSAAVFYNTEYPENEHNLFLLMPLRL